MSPADAAREVAKHIEALNAWNHDHIESAIANELAYSWRMFADYLKETNDSEQGGNASMD